MCGIAGLYARNGRAVAEATVRAQCDALVHRGPDDQGVFCEGDFGFGMRRLSIVDLAGGHQPMWSADRRFGIVFNGEIVNHRDLRGPLAEAGHVFHTGSDTETVLAAFLQWGDDAWNRLEGMFAIAIWDAHARRLVLVRDQLGIKPLYVSAQNGGVAFASELKALAMLPGLCFAVDPRAVHDFFSYGHIRHPRSIYRQVAMLPPGHMLSIDATGEPVRRRYWRARYAEAPKRSERDWIEAFRERWIETVRKHMLADVEVGAFLSGGIDSSAVVAAMAQASDRPIRTFTIGFPVAKYDESPVAEKVAHHLGCRHVTRMLDLRSARDILPQVSACYDEPFADPSAIPTWYVAQVAREEVKAVLSGDGGDELFMGYKRHLTEARVGALPPFARRLARSITALPPTPVRRWNYVLQRWQKAVGGAALPDGITRFFAKTQISSPALRKRVYDPAFHAACEGPDAFEALRDEYFPDPAATVSPNTLDQFAYADLTLNLPSCMLTKVDRASMAHSLEVRVPMLSHDFVEWGLTIPRDLTIRGGVGKYILREAIKPWLPEGVVDRRKQGFQIPLAEWFSGDFGAYAEELWTGSGAREAGFLDPRAVADLFREHRSGTRNHGRFLFALAIFSLWWQRSRGLPSAL